MSELLIKTALARFSLRSVGRWVVQSVRGVSEAGMRQCGAVLVDRGNGLVITGGEYPPPCSPELLKLRFGSSLVGASGVFQNQVCSIFSRPVLKAPR